MRIISRLLFVFVFMLWTGAALRAEEYATDDEVYEYAISVPRYIENDLDRLTRYLTRPYHNKYDKAKSIAYWIASHVIYDGYVLEKKSDGYAGYTKVGKKYDVQDGWDLMESRVGICADYAVLFMEMASKAGIKAKIVSGKIRKLGHERDFIPKQYDLGHAWNSFRYMGRDIYVDTTWMAQGRSMEVDKRASKREHERALKKVKKGNKKVSHVYSINPYYFDFTYDRYNKYSHPKNEPADKGIIRIGNWFDPE